MLNLWLNQDQDAQKSGKFVNMDHLFEETGNSFNLHDMTSGTEFFVNNNLFDQKTVDEWLRIKDKPNRPYSIVDQIIESNYKHKNYLKKNDRFALSLGMQSFQNYIPFNIPITDIFVRKYTTEISENNGNRVSINYMHHVPFFIQNLELMYPE